MFQTTNQIGILQGESTKADLLECIVTNGYKWLVNWDLTTKCRDITNLAPQFRIARLVQRSRLVNQPGLMAN